MWVTKVGQLLANGSPVEVLPSVDGLDRKVTLASYTPSDLHFAFSATDIATSGQRISLASIVSSTVGNPSIEFVLPAGVSLWIHNPSTTTAVYALFTSGV